MARRHLNKLNIEYVGCWGKKSGIEELQYDESWIENERGRPLSLSLPFTPGNCKRHSKPAVICRILKISVFSNLQNNLFRF